MIPENSVESARCTSCDSAVNRRSFLQAFAAGLGLAVLGGCGKDAPDEAAKAPAGIAAIAAGNEWKIPGAEKLKAGEAIAFQLADGKPGLVFVSSQNQLVAISAKCTHAGCTVEWKDGKELHCPCHGSRFDLAGKVLNGPATAPLAVYTARKEGDDVLIKVAK